MNQVIASKKHPVRPRGRRVGPVHAAAAGLIAVPAALLAAGTASAAPTPSTQVTFSPATISAGTRPNLTFTSQGAPSGALFILQESTDGGAHWKGVERTSNTAGSSPLPAASAGSWDYRILMTEGNTVLAASAPAVLTVTGPGGETPAAAPSPSETAAPSSAPSSGGIPWMEFVVKPVWDAIVGSIVSWVLSWF